MQPLFSPSQPSSSPQPNFATIGDKMSIARIGSYESEIARVSAIKNERWSVISSLAEEINTLWGELGFAPADEYDACIAPPNKGLGLGWTTGAIELLQGKARSLAAEKSIREERIMIIGQQITTLWKRLATPEDEQTAFLESHAGIGDDVISAVSRAPRARVFAHKGWMEICSFHSLNSRAHIPHTPTRFHPSLQCEEYLATKQSEFAARLVDLVGGARATISGQWEELRWGASQREAAFPQFYAKTEDFTDDLFLQHEAYIATLNQTLEAARPLLKAVEKRESILKERAEYEALMSDPQRLLIKGSSAA
jgi:hypothetical protein